MVEAVVERRCRAALLSNDGSSPVLLSRVQSKTSIKP